MIWFLPILFCRGNLDKAKKHFDVSIEFAKTELELAHLYALQAAAIAQSSIATKYGLRPAMMPQAMWDRNLEQDGAQMLWFQTYSYLSAVLQ